jgi:hypothetical protein
MRFAAGRGAAHHALKLQTRSALPAPTSAVRRLASAMAATTARARSRPPVSLLWLLSSGAGAAAGAGTCPAGTFKSSTNLTLCANLTKQPQIDALEACRELCCADQQCGTWQWCPNDSRESSSDRLGGCARWAGARCHTGPAPSAACPGAAHWVGETRAELPPPPPSPPPPGPPAPPPPRRLPATRKQGFSGFLGPDYTCGDAAALGLSDSWFYTWMTNAAQYSRCESPSDQAAEFVPMINGAKKRPFCAILC